MRRCLAEFENEVAFLSAPPDGFVAPRLLASGTLRDGNWLVREIIEGQELYELILNCTPYDADKLIGDILQQLIILECQGLYHDDVRDSNVVLSSAGDAHVVDFGSISRIRRDCDYPDDLILAFLAFVRQVTGRIHPGVLPNARTQRAVLLNVEALPDWYRRAFQELFLKPVGEWSFAALKNSLDRQASCRGHSPRLAPGAYFLAAVLQRALEDHQQVILSLQEELRGQATKLQDKSNELESITNELESVASELKSVYASNSWRFATPMRAAGDAVRRIVACLRALFATE